MSQAVAYAPQVPPGEDELPSSFGPPMDTERHGFQMDVLVGSLRRHWATREDVYVAGNMAMYFSAAQIKKNDFLGPDVFVVLDTHRGERKSWVVWEEDRSPDLVIELISPSTESNDRGPKKEIYARALRVPEYFLYDPLDQRFEGYRLDSLRGVYRPMTRDEDGGYSSGRTGLRLAIRDTLYYGEPTPFLRWLDEDGQLLPTGDEAAELAEREAEAQRARAEALAARLRALGVDPEAP